MPRHKMFSLFDRLPEELRVRVWQLMGCDMTIPDWMQVETELGRAFGVAFGAREIGMGIEEWAGEQQAGGHFGKSPGTELEVQFLVRHVERA